MIITDHYQSTLKQSIYGTGGEVKRAITAATAVIQGLVGTHNLGAAVAGGAEPYIAGVIKENIAVSQEGNSSSSFSKYLEKEKLINPATNKNISEHIIASSGKAPKTSTPNAICEISRADGTRSITYYDDKGRTFSREDYGQQRIHGQLGYDSSGKAPPHEHKITYNERGYVDKKYYREIDNNGNSVGFWIEDKK